VLGREVVESRLPDIADFCRTYLNVDPADEPMPVQPTAHYAMGGIPTDLDGRVTDGKNIYDGLYAAGECACVSVHGANRLGTNSLVDLIVFGRRAGMHVAEYVRGAELSPMPEDSAESARSFLGKLKDDKSGPSINSIFEKMQETMMTNVGVYRRADGMQQAVKDIIELREEAGELRLQDKNVAFNNEVLDIIELNNLLDLSLFTAESALNRTESRGAHSREDFPERDDENWLKHTMARLENDRVSIFYKDVDLSRWKPKPRVY
jgi:succinate dehydrogenase / fumarate reductase flavoprotein subunit